MPYRRFLHASLAAAALAAPAPAQPSPVDGLWRGSIVYRPAEIELETTVELASAAGGELVGTIDVPSQRMRFHPLAGVTLDGERVEITFRRHSEARGPDALYRFTGTLVEGGERIEGEFVGWHSGESDRAAFFLERVGPPGADRPPEVQPPLERLAPSGEPLRQAFNRHPEAFRLVLLLSPT